LYWSGLEGENALFPIHDKCGVVDCIFVDQGRIKDKGKENMRDCGNLLTFSPISNLQGYTGIAPPDEVEKSGRVFADDGLVVVASDVVPLETVLVDVVEDTQASLGRVVDGELGVIGLGGLEVTSGAPWLIAPAGRSAVGLGQLHLSSRPEPSLDDQRFQILTRIAALEVAHAAARPDVRQVFSFDDLCDHVVFSFAFDADGIHAVFAAQVSRVEPVVPLAGVSGHGVAQEVEMSAELPLFRSVDASVKLGFLEKTTAVVDFAGLGGGCGGGYLSRGGYFVGVFVLVGVFVTVFVGVFVTVFVTVFVSVFVVVVVVVAVSSEQLLQIGSAVHHADHCKAYDQQLAKHCRWDTLCLTAMVGFTGRCELFDGDECRLPLITESGYMKTAFLD